MKKLLIILCMLAGLQEANAQTEAETLEWLNVKKVDVGCSDVRFTSDSIIMGDGESQWATIILWKDIKDMTIEARSHITIKGKVIIKWLGGKGIWEDEKSPSMQLSTGGYTEVIEKFVKALKHQATLKGAKLLKDDLF